MSNKHTRKLLIDGCSLTLDQVAKFLAGDVREVALAPKAKRAVRKGRQFVVQLLKQGKPVYGINTGFGRLSSVSISSDKLEELQTNLIRSHACGVGDPLDQDDVRLAMLLRINSLARGHSGVRVEVLETFTRMINRGVVPWVPRKGSVGASGDLAPLSHIALTAMGEGRAYWNGRLVSAATAMKKAEIKPIRFSAKEGLALINGTQIIQAIGLVALVQARVLIKLADLAGAMSLEALRGTDVPFDPRLAELRPHPGHATAAANMRKLLRKSQIRASHRNDDPRVQDAYSLRCIPQVHGAVRDGLGWAIELFERELNAVTDNPILFPDTGDVLSGGNFHGQPLAMGMDYFAIAMSELGAMSERRVESMVNPDLSGLPPFLVEDAGLNSGMMMAQVTAAALASENKVLAHPASVDTIPTGANKEDHVSMGVTAARKAREVLENVRQIIGLELLCARFALEYRRPLKPGALVNDAFEIIAGVVKPLRNDRVIYLELERMQKLIRDGAFDGVLAKLK